MTLAILRPLAAVAVLATLATPVLAKPASLAQRLQALEDQEAIRGVLERYFEYQESGQTKAFAALFAKDGELVLRRGVSRGGPAGILASMSRTPTTTDAPRARGPRGMRHILSNVHITISGDAATAESRWTMLVAGDDNRARLGGTGRYVDKLVREDGQWKFQKRVIARDIPIDVEGANPATE